jgi:hypothetical protein
MVINSLIFLSEVTKLGLLYLAKDYGLNSSLTLAGYWLVWEALFAMLLGKFSDIKGRKLLLIITVSSSLVVSILGRSRDLFVYSLLVDGILASATLPIAFAAKNDQNPTRSKRLTYAEAFQFRSLPWVLVPLIYLLLGFPSHFWDRAMLVSSIASFILLFFFRDKKDTEIGTSKARMSHLFFVSSVSLALIAFFFAEISYQTTSYIVEEKEELASLTKSYILFGLGLFFTSSLHKVVRLIHGISIARLTGVIFLSTAFYFLIRFLSFSWEDSHSALNYTEKTILGASSGLYIPLIYAAVCDQFGARRQGFLCGVLETTTTVAEIAAPLFAAFLLQMSFPENVIFLIIGFGFFLAFTIISSYWKSIFKIFKKCLCLDK